MLGECFDDNTAVEFLDGVLPEAASRRVEAHAARCDICRRLLAELGRADSRDDQVPTAPLGADAHLALEPGEKVGRFTVLSRIGSGGMGVVFAASDPQLGRKIALKLLRSSADAIQSASAARTRLLREARAMAQISHPNVISVYDLGTYKSEVYIAMEFVEGGTLTSWLRRWQRPWRDILDKFLMAGSALAEAHAGGLAHRDFKPDNVLVGSDERVRVMDFGLARSLLFDAPAPAGDAAQIATPGASLLQAVTGTGALVGTPRYMAPEQLAGQETDARSDQFSFCVALYEALYGVHPFEGDTAAGIDRSATPRPPPADTEVPGWLHRALVRGLSFDAKDRFPTMQALLRAITPPPAQPSRARLAAGVAVTLLALLTAGYAVSAWLEARGQSQQMSGEMRAARARIAELEREVHALQRYVAELQGQSGTQDQVIRELEQRLAEAGTALEQAEQALAQGAAPAATAPRTRPRASPPPPSPQGLRRGELLAILDPRRYDLVMCFREWLERAPEDRLLLGVRLRIGPDGVPALDKVRGVADRVVRECVTGNLMRLRFPARDAITVVDYKFHRDNDASLTTAADVTQVLPAPEPPALTEPALADAP